MKTKLKDDDHVLLKHIIIGQIADRALAIGIRKDKMRTMADIELADIDTPLDLTGLLAADDINFTHDIFRIKENKWIITFQDSRGRHSTRQA